ncbi:hypothetical protein C2G38_2188839 [Gigaspora rosea]|uniref:Uncharacterized protein n=1 Tax=Gigaspora rosea TaxID=44941 RepID=A0A397V2W5_9GLOM|nr:hypothetical protein C2G38_2188839 [Gigaspora rosea]
MYRLKKSVEITPNNAFVVRGQGIPYFILYNELFNLDYMVNHRLLSEKDKNRASEHSHYIRGNNIVAKYPDKLFESEDFISLPESALILLIK